MTEKKGTLVIGVGVTPSNVLNPIEQPYHHSCPKATEMLYQLEGKEEYFKVGGRLVRGNSEFLRQTAHQIVDSLFDMWEEQD